MNISIKSKIRKEIESILKELSFNIKKDFVIEHPNDLSHGDYASNIPMILSKKENKNPRELAEIIKSKLEGKEISEIEKIEIAGPGFINFFLSKNFYKNSLKEILEKKEDFGKNEIGKEKKVIVEYSSPNIAKPFTVGHLRSTIIGESIARILFFSGYEVIRDNHLGDWGTQFGKMIYALKTWGNEDEITKSKNPVKDLVALYVKFHREAEENEELNEEGRKCFKKLEEGDEEARRIWKKCIDWSMLEFEKIYKRLEIKFDTNYGESFFIDKVQTVMDDLSKKDFYKESEGAKLIFFEEDKKLPPLMIQKSDGATLYATRDLAVDKFRKEKYGDDILIINEVGKEQSLYFKQIFEAEEMLGYFPKSQRVHMAHGHYRFKDGKMSTRKGDVIWLEDIIDRAVTLAGKISKEKEIAEKVAMGAIKFNDLKREISRDIIFDFDEILNLQGDSGPYLQYTYARTQSLLKKGEDLGIYPSFENKINEIENIQKLMYRFPEIVKISLEEYEPHHIANYLLEISREFNSFYGNKKILDIDDPSSEWKLAITKAMGIIVKNGLNLLGIEVLDEM